MFKIPEWKYLKYRMQQKWQDLTASKSYSGKSYKGDSILHRLAGVRIFMSTHPAAKISVYILCLTVIISAIWMSLFSNDDIKVDNSRKAWFYDINTGELFTAEKIAFPPIETESGPLENGQPAGVLANVLTYDPTGRDKSQEFIGYLVKLTDEGKRLWSEALENNSLEKMNWETGKLIKRPEDENWFKADSPEGMKIKMLALKPNDKGQIPTFVKPR